MKKNIAIISVVLVGLLVLFLSIGAIVQRSSTSDRGKNAQTVTDAKHTGDTPYASDEGTAEPGTARDSEDDTESDTETETKTEPVTGSENSADPEPTVPDATDTPNVPEPTTPATTPSAITAPPTPTTAPDVQPEPETEGVYIDKIEVVPDIPAEEHSEFLPNLEPAQITLLKPVASGVLTESNESAIIDYSNTKDGYVMVKYLENTSDKLRVQVTGPTATYTYTISFDNWEVFPLSDGNGEYTVKVFKNVVDSKYSLKLSLNCNVVLDNEFAPFIRPNQYVNYEYAVNTMNKAAELVAGKTELLDKVEAIYRYVVGTLSYDYEKAATVTSGYLPDLDAVLATKKGICFDYAALMTGMLRSQNIPCKLVVGYANETYHAWINVWSQKTGWIEGTIFFDGVSWQRMDPTFASTSGSLVVDGINYTSKYFY